ncbi:MAG: EamA family transporter [Verrucomicrobia bacterium]|jgi:drug/metabolite transporter (DMT)-like permease|nr:EamA family transporter [Verrucomicrobiota bacterium]
MHYLAVVSLIWALSFGLIGNSLAGLDSIFIATARLGIAGLVFAPFLKFSTFGPATAYRLLFCGAIQFGVMYVCYMRAFLYLPSHLVALFSILTPLYIVLIHDLRQKRFHPHYLYAALLSVVGAAIIRARSGSFESIWTGFALMQVAGLAFGFGQVYYRDWKRKNPEIAQLDSFAWLYAGGFLVALLASFFFTDWAKASPNGPQAAIILYLGIIASGLGFFLWNKGATLTRPGTLAAFNNAVVPLAMASSLFIFDEISDLAPGAVIRLLLGASCILAAVILAEKTPAEH